MFGSLAADFKHLRIDNQLITTRGFKTRQIAYLPQATFLPPFVKVSELLGTIVIGKEILLNSELNNGDFSNHRVGDLSGGKLRFLECLWILNQPAPYILLDEPFSGVAPILVESLQGAIREAGKTKAIVLTDHIYRPLLEISDRVVLLHNNSIYAIRSDDDLIRYSYVPDFS